MVKLRDLLLLPEAKLADLGSLTAWQSEDKKPRAEA